jgi:predicted RNase H-like nuclease (RuvC/YqgF family)
MDKMKLERLLDAETIAIYLDEIYGDSARKTIDTCKELRRTLTEAIEQITMIEDSKAEVATKDAEIEELKTLMAEMAETIRELKAKVDAPKAGNDTPIGLS